jgi:type IV pilus assembly protein PilA
MAMRHDGFSMMELMVVLAVIAILALMAVPSLTDKIIRDQIVESLPLADIAKAPVSASWATTRTLPADNAAAGLPASDKIVNNYIRSVSVREGAIDITFGNNAHTLIKDKVLTLRAAVVEDSPVVPVTWVCGNAAAPAPMTIRGENGTNIPAGYLPLKCR